MKYLEIKQEMIGKIQEFNNKLIDEIIFIKNDLYPDAYPANLFKNSARCRAIEDKLGEKNFNE